MGEIVRMLQERLEAEDRLQAEMRVLRQDYQRRHPGEECEVRWIGQPGGNLYVGPPIRKRRQERIAT
jgi:hypothetical protein